MFSKGQGSAYIVLPSEYGPSDQTDINRKVFLDPLGRWSMIREVDPDWALQEGRRPGPDPVLPPLRFRGFWSLLDDRKLAHTLISLCKPNVWAFHLYFLITPCRNRQTPKLMEFYQIKP